MNQSESFRNMCFFCKWFARVENNVYFCLPICKAIIMNNQDNNFSFFRFEDLRIYYKVIDYISWLYGEFADDSICTCETELKKSFLNSAQSIALITAEGSSRNKTQFIDSLKNAKSAVWECVVYTEIAARREIFDADAREYSRSQLMELTKMFGSLINSLQKSSGSNREEKEFAYDPHLPSLDEL